MIIATKALAWASTAHEGQLDKAGRPILGHLLRVAASVTHMGEDAIAAALLHDIVEDGGVTVDQIYEEFGPEIAQAVELLTHKGEPYEQYLRKIRTRGGLALQIKLADNIDNGSWERLELLPQPIRERLARKYAQARTILMEF